MKGKERTRNPERKSLGSVLTYMHDHTGGIACQNQGAFYRVEGNGDWLINQLIDCLIDLGQIQDRQTYHLDDMD